MPSWLKGIVPAVFSLLEKPLTSLAAYWAGLRQGRTKQRADQSDLDMEAALKARRARNRVSPNVMHDDPRNRDNH